MKASGSVYTCYPYRNMSRFVRLQILLLIPVLFMQCSDGDSRQERDPRNALSTFSLADGFTIELIASEPLVEDPVAMEVDENGSIYVVEMHGYPLDKSGTGIIKVLSDSDGDGRPDKSEIFADGLVLPTGIMRWKQGIVVIDTPDVLYFEDSDGDGRADLRRKMLTGFALSNPQHIANTPVFGLDNWIYIAHQGEVTPQVYKKEFGDSGSPINFPDDPSAPTLPINADGRSIRFRPDAKEVEMLSGESQYGQAFDAWGHHLGTSNANHLFHEVIAARYLDRNPNLRLANSMQMLPDHGDAAEVYPTTLNPLHQLLTDVGVITSSCGVIWYGGGAFPDSFNQVTFIAEPVHNLVHADRISDKGATFNASRVYERKEFLSSTDPWFRPVYFYIGPDGALYLIDYYRQIIEHPEWMSEEAAKSGELYNGTDRGRIFRIAPVGAPPASWCNAISMTFETTDGLVRELTNRNVWWRRNAQRLLLDRNDHDALAGIHKLIDTTTFAPAIVHALWTLEGLRATDPGYLRTGLRHVVPGVRENAIRIAELHLKDIPGIESDLLDLQNDPNPKVRFQLLCTLGFLDDTESIQARQKLLTRDVEDDWVQVAALTSLAGKEMAMIEGAIKTFGQDQSEGRKSFFIKCASVVGLSRSRNDIRKTMQYATRHHSPRNGWWQSALLDGLTAVIKETGVSSSLGPEKQMLLAEFNASAFPEVRRSSLQLLRRMGTLPGDVSNDLIEKATEVAANQKNSPAYREDALLLLALDNQSVESTLFEQLIQPTEPEDLQKLAIDVFGSLDPNAACQYLVASWKNLTPNVRDAGMNVFLRSESGMNVLLDAVEDGKVQSSTIGWRRTVELMNNEIVGIRNRARELLSGPLADRDEVIVAYQPALDRMGDMSKGEGIFKRNCSICHQVNGENGVAFGPDLATIRNRDAQFILVDILHPNRSIADGYELWKVKRKNGEELTGVISAETSATLTVKFANGEEVTIPRSDLSTVVALDNSAMPVGLENAISVEEMADLLSYLKHI